MSGSVVIGGSVAQKAHNAGHTWQFLQYLLGFRRLGFEVLLLDSFPGAGERQLRYVADTMAAHGLGGDWSVDLGGGAHAGRSRAEVLERVRGADLLLNVMGFVTDSELLGAARRRVFLDTDPGFGQMWRDLGLADVFTGHDAHVTIGERIGAPDCTIPTCGIDWVTTRQPVVLAEWPRAAAPPLRPFTSIGSWRGAYAPIEHGGRRYGLRVHEFRRFADLPRRTGGEFDLALAIDPGETRDLDLLDRGGWRLLDPRQVASTTHAYRDFIAASKAELMVAKGIYVQSRSGWFSERSACYLASGRPVLAQDTGLTGLLPVGEGLLAFDDAEGAVAGVERISSEYRRHCAAAREFAEEHLDSRRVLARLVEAVA